MNDETDNENLDEAFKLGSIEGYDRGMKEGSETSYKIGYEEGFKEGLGDSYNEGVAAAIYFLVDEFTKIDKKWSKKAAYFCEGLLEINDENENEELPGVR